MPSHRSETVRSGPRGTQAEGPCDCGSVAYSSCMLPLKGLQDRVAVKGSSRELVGGARGFFALAWGVTLSHHFDRVDRCSADQRMSDVRPAWSQVNSAIRCEGGPNALLTYRPGLRIVVPSLLAMGRELQLWQQSIPRRADSAWAGDFSLPAESYRTELTGRSGLDPIPRHAIRHPRFRVC